MATVKPRKKPKARKSEPTKASVAAFLAGLDEPRRADCKKLDAWMRAATGCAGVMYGEAMVGYGTSMVRYADGREEAWFAMGFSPRKQALTLYGLVGSATPSLLQRLGKHSTAKHCLYIKRLGDIDAEVLRQIIERAAN